MTIAVEEATKLAAIGGECAGRGHIFHWCWPEAAMPLSANEANNPRHLCLICGTRFPTAHLDVDCDSSQFRWCKDNLNLGCICGLHDGTIWYNRRKGNRRAWDYVFWWESDTVVNV